MVMQTSRIQGSGVAMTPAAEVGVSGAERKKSFWGSRLNQLIALGAAAILLNALYDHSVESREGKSLRVGAPIPAFSLDALGGGPLTQKSFAGKPTVYFFFADWCPCSHQSVQWITRALDDHRAAGLAMVGVGVQNGRDKLERFARRYDLPFPVAVRGGDGLADVVGVTITPTTLFVDGDGVIRSVFVGKIDEYGQLTEGLKSILPPGQGPA